MEKCTGCSFENICKKIFESCMEEENKAKSSQTFYHDSSIIWSIYRNIVNRICRNGGSGLNDDLYFVVYIANGEVYHVTRVGKNNVPKLIKEAMLEQGKRSELSDNQKEEIAKLKMSLETDTWNKPCLSVKIGDGHYIYVLEDCGNLPPGRM